MKEFPASLNLQPYKGRPDSGVRAFQIGENYIIVQFKKEEIYLYDEERICKENINKMKEKALAAKGLSTYITRTRPKIYNRYTAKWNDVLKKFEPNTDR